MSEIRKFTYTDAKGKVTQRKAIVMSKPYPHYRMLDISELDGQQTSEVLAVLEEIEDFRGDRMADLANMIGQNPKYMWRSFKEDKIEWKDDIK